MHRSLIVITEFFSGEIQVRVLSAIINHDEKCRERETDGLKSAESIFFVFSIFSAFFFQARGSHTKIQKLDNRDYRSKITLWVRYQYPYNIFQFLESFANGNGTFRHSIVT